MTIVLDGDRLPERRRRLHGPVARPASITTEHAAGPTAVDGATADTAYYRYTVVVCALMFLLALVHVAGKPGRAWASIRESEPAALAAGVNITLYKLWAFALASFMTGVAGCLLAAQVGSPARDQRSRRRTRSRCRDGADRRHLQPLGRGRRRRLPAARAVPLPGAVGRSTRTSS